MIRDSELISTHVLSTSSSSKPCICLDLIEYLQEGLRLFGTLYFVFAVKAANLLSAIKYTPRRRQDSRKVGHTADELPLRIGDLPIDFRATFASIHPFPSLSLVQPSSYATFDQDFSIGDILVNFKISVEKLFDDFRLHVLALCFRELDQAMRVSRVPSLAAKVEIDAYLFS
jgi:hypothetical protein